jgi:hypothetical protein
MAEKEKKDQLADISKVDVEPLTDADLDTVAGGGLQDGFAAENNASTGCTTNSNVANACC